MAIKAGTRDEKNSMMSVVDNCPSRGVSLTCPYNLTAGKLLVPSFKCKYRQNRARRRDGDGFLVDEVVFLALCLSSSMVSVERKPNESELELISGPYGMHVVDLSSSLTRLGGLKRTVAC
jgi:hypothetical protein